MTINFVLYSLNLLELDLKYIFFVFFFFFKWWEQREWGENMEGCIVGAALHICFILNVAEEKCIILLRSICDSICGVNDMFPAFIFDMNLWYESQQLRRTVRSLYMNKIALSLSYKEGFFSWPFTNGNRFTAHSMFNFHVHSWINHLQR